MDKEEKPLGDVLGTIKANDKEDENIELIRNEALAEIRKEQAKEKEKKDEKSGKKSKNKNAMGYPDELASDTLEKIFIGILLNEVKDISMYYFLYDDCYFVNEDYLNIYKQILFTDGEKYAPGVAKEGFNFGKESSKLLELRNDLKYEYAITRLNMEKVYMELKKLFVLRKSYLGIPVSHIQEQVADIVNYELYDIMSVEEVEAAVEQITATEKFKRAILNDDMTGFILRGDNSLTNGLTMPFPILSEVFKGLRQGEITAFSMPSNAGKSRFTVNIITYLALVHKKKVLLISNEMSEEKMRLCLTTTILNMPAIQKIHGQKIHVSENELLALQFRPDPGKDVEVDENGYIKRDENESQRDYVKKLAKNSTVFNQVRAVTDWFDRQVHNMVYFINITDHTNDELKKVIMNYYYKEKVEYVFYDTMKTDIDNIGNGEELKKTATILSNLAQIYKMYIGATLQLQETTTDPINLDINDLSVSRTVKEVLDTLCLFKQIHNENLYKYEYSKNEVDTEYFDLVQENNPDIRYYTCVVDKNRAGPKPKLVFKINLAYNSWEELGYIRLKND